MFNEVHGSITTENGTSSQLAFVKSLNVSVYPCGRRKSTQIDQDNSSNTSSDKYQIPFDPEARLNTEQNNRKLSGINGFADTYLKSWDKATAKLLLVLAGYSFEISLKGISENGNFDYSDPDNFGKALMEILKPETDLLKPEVSPKPEAADVYKIYANIRLEEIPLYSGFTDYFTWVLRNQSGTSVAAAELDRLATNGSSAKADDYYFSGLSFSTVPITGKDGPRSDLYISSEEVTELNQTRDQKVFSLCILKKAQDGPWVIDQSALLPTIAHGDTENSIVLGSITTETIDTDKIGADEAEVTDLDAKTVKSEKIFLKTSNGNKQVPAVELVDIGAKYQLRFYFPEELQLYEPSGLKLRDADLGDLGIDYEDDGTPNYSILGGAVPGNLEPLDE